MFKFERDDPFPTTIDPLVEVNPRNKFISLADAVIKVLLIDIFVELSVAPTPTLFDTVKL